jgi:hypothetical protein
MFKILEIYGKEIPRDPEDTPKGNDLNRNDTKKTSSHDPDYTKSNSFIDVHVFDTKSEKIVIPRYTDEEKQICLKILYSLLRNENAKKMLTIIQGRNNYDSINGIDGLDLLYWICSNYITRSIFNLLEEQLSDNLCLGTCLQGTSARLRQIYYIQKDLKK